VIIFVKKLKTSFTIEECIISRLLNTQGGNSDVVDAYENLLGSSFDKEAAREEYISTAFAVPNFN
jgi:hypothetical protein